MDGKGKKDMEGIGGRMDRGPGKGMDGLDLSRIEGNKACDKEENVAGDAIHDEDQAGTELETTISNHISMTPKI